MVHELIQCYGYCDPKLVVELINIFGRSFYGSPLWRLESEEFGKLTRSWNTVVKMVWDLPYATHKRFVESLTVVPHLQSTLHSRYVGFMKNLQNSGKLQTTVMYNLCKNDLNSQTGQNIHLLLQSYEAEDMASLINMKDEIKLTRVNPLEEAEEWKPILLDELCLAKHGLIDLEFDPVQMDMIIDMVATA